MDMAFLDRAERMLALGEPARIDHSILLATLAAQRRENGSHGVSIEAAVTGGALDEEPLIELVLAGPTWRQALAAQRGCFSRAEAGRRINVR
ncbi:MAG TPA: hypothetical protein VF704_13485 [Allosphingosinicella sp.]|jgi:hypothetical protein